MSVEVKICGITDVIDAQLAAEYGARYLGMIFVPDTPRYIRPVEAQEIVDALPRHVLVTGVFMNAASDTIRQAVDSIGLDVIQLHGDEPPGKVQRLREALELPIIKAISLTPDVSAEVVLAYQDSADYLLFDRPKGSDEADWLDWALDTLCRWHEESGLKPFFFAGGLTPETVSTVMASPLPVYGLDVASGVESAPGRKDRFKLKAFIEAAKQFTHSQSEDASPCNR